MEEEPAFLDANVLLRHFLNDHPQHSPRATRMMARVARGEMQIHISEAVLAETVFVLERTHRQPKTLIRDVLVGLLNLPDVLLPGKRRLYRVLDIYVDRNIPYVDAHHIVTMEQLAVDRIITFDRHFDNVPGITRIEP